jgi:hypothetical protein
MGEFGKKFGVMMVRKMVLKDKRMATRFGPGR